MKPRCVGFLALADLDTPAPEQRSSVPPSFLATYPSSTPQLQRLDPRTCRLDSCAQMHPCASSRRRPRRRCSGRQLARSSPRPRHRPRSSASIPGRSPAAQRRYERSRHSPQLFFPLASRPWFRSPVHQLPHDDHSRRRPLPRHVPQPRRTTHPTNCPSVNVSKRS